jgi:hypothetical protein
MPRPTQENRFLSFWTGSKCIKFIRYPQRSDRREGPIGTARDGLAGPRIRSISGSLRVTAPRMIAGAKWITSRIRPSLPRKTSTCPIMPQLHLVRGRLLRDNTRPVRLSRAAVDLARSGDRTRGKNTRRPEARC